jgi:HptB-dependent secretion and biofilm anti anti-sigma factor
MQFTFDGGAGQVALSGEFTFTDHVSFKDLVSRLLEAEQPQIVIDLSKLDFIDSAGLGMLLLVREAAGKASRKVVLRGPHGQVKRMFDVTKFSTLFSVEQ